MANHRWPEPLATRLSGTVQRARLRLTNRLDGMRQSEAPGTITIVGCYNTSNIGDRSFAAVLLGIASREGIPAASTSYGIVSGAQLARPILLGGGGLLNGTVHTPLSRLMLDPGFDGASGHAMVSISTSYGVSPLRPALRDKLERFRFLGVRDAVTATWLRTELPNTKVVLHPDIAFALPRLGSISLPPRQQRTVGINIMPVLMERREGAWSAKSRFSDAFVSANPKLAALGSATAESYVAIVQDAVHQLLRAGHKVIHVPFALEDDALARALFRHTSVRCLPFRNDPFSVLNAVARCEAFIATRFHAHVFALATATPLLSLPYSDKCSLLLQELGLESGAEPERWTSHGADVAARLRAFSNAVQLSPPTLEATIHAAEHAAGLALRALRST